ncbi:hypothetical protein ABK040_014207 [Willaertia magna]
MLSQRLKNDVIRRKHHFNPLGLLLLLISLFCFIGFSVGVLEKEAGTIDWFKENIGRVKLLEGGFANKGIAIVATQQGVLAALNIRTGAFQWRRVFQEGEKIEQLTPIGSDKFISISSALQKRTIKLWNYNDGSLIFDKTLISPFSKGDVLQISNQLIFLIGDQLFSKDLRNGSEKWNIKATHGIFYKLVNVNDKEIKVIGFDTDDKQLTKLNTFIINLENGSVLNERSIDIKAPLSNNVAITNDEVVFLQDDYLTLYNLKSGNQSVTKLDIDTSNSEIITIDNEYFLQDENGVKRSLKDINKNLISSPYFNLDDVSYQGVVESQKSDSFTLLLKRVDNNQVISTHTLPLSFEKHGLVQRVFVQVVKSQENAQNLIKRFIVVTEDDAIIGYKENELLWTREESLASVDNIQFVDLPISNTENTESSVQSMGERITLQIEQVKDLINRLVSNIQQLLGESPNAKTTSVSKSLVQDRFGFQKLIVVKTKSGKLFALHSVDGSVIWSLFPKGLLEWSGNVSIRSYLTKKQQVKDDIKVRPEITLLISKNEKTSVFVVDVLEGKIINTKELNYQLLDAILLPSHDKHRLHPLLIIDPNYQVHIYPETNEMKQLVKEFPLNINFYTKDLLEGKLTGYSWNANQTKTVQTWTNSLHTQIQSFASITNPLNQHIYSGIIVTPSGNVLYKYLNPALFAISTITNEGNESGLNIYIIDGVTGHIVYQVHHEGATGPVNMILDENLLVYHYTNVKQMRYEITSIELFNEGTEFQKKGFGDILKEKIFGTKDVGVLSSYNYGKPIAKRNTFIFPVGIRSMGISQTLIGITNKQIILSLTNDQLYLLDKRLIDARRPKDPANSPDEIQEGLIPYNPYLPYVTTLVPNYFRPVHRINLIETSPSILESTTLMFSSGLDLFFTRLSPSKKFDILNDDFNYLLLIVSVSSILVLSYVAKWYANKKELKAKWDA